MTSELIGSSESGSVDHPLNVAFLLLKPSPEANVVNVVPFSILTALGATPVPPFRSYVSVTILAVFTTTLWFEVTLEITGYTYVPSEPTAFAISDSLNSLLSIAILLMA